MPGGRDAFAAVGLPPHRTAGLGCDGGERAGGVAGPIV
jgi:hypothetical protein